MRKYFILFALCIFFAGISYYLATTLDPFDEVQIAQLVHSQKITVSAEFDQVIADLTSKGLITEFLDLRNVTLISTTVLLSVFTSFMFLHLIVDKLFFRKFFEQPSLAVAFRRGVFVCVGLISAFIYKLYAAEWYLTALTLGLLLIVELVIGRLVPVKHAEVEELEAELDGQQVTNSTQPESTEKPKREFKLRLPHIRQWPGKFKEKVMRQVTEIEAIDTPNTAEILPNDSTDEIYEDPT